jgi:hypothetical protein
MSEKRTQAMREILAQRIRDEPAARRTRLRRRLALWGGAGLIGTAVLSTGAAFLFGSAPVTDTTIVHCLSSTTRTADGTYPGSAATIADGNGPGRVDDALALCAQMWQQGALSPNADPTAPTRSPGQVPPLQVCVMRDGTAAVVPSSTATVCQSLGMASLQAE